MTVAELKLVLDALRYPRDAYSIGSDRDEAYCLIASETGWHVYYSERGNHNEERIFTDEANACGDLLSRLERDDSVQPRDD